MKQKLRKIITQIRYFTHVAQVVCKALWNAHSRGQLKSALRWLWIKIRGYLGDLESFPHLLEEQLQLENKSLLALQKKTLGLHSLLPQTEQFRYSILIPVHQPILKFFEKTLRSVLNQTSPHFEVILGLNGPQSPEIQTLIETLKNTTFPARPKLFSIQLPQAEAEKEAALILNQLAQSATGNFLFLMNQHDWITPDLLFRYEQVLRLLKHPEKTVLYCNEYQINERDECIPGTHQYKVEHPSFPYYFKDWIGNSLLIPRSLWNEVGGFTPTLNEVQTFDLALKLDQAGALFQLVPFYFYAHRSIWQLPIDQTLLNQRRAEAGISSFQNYCHQKNLDWEISTGYLNGTFRAIPRTHSSAQRPIHVIIPYKNQKEITLQAVHKLHQQKGVKLWITAVDNQSDDLTIAEELQRLQVEVLRINEPFNFSRLNNLAVKNSKYHSESENLLFLNNDVLLEPEAIQEMIRWMDQPKVGAVGARLHYPNGLLQHGGVNLSLGGTANRMTWQHVDYHGHPDHLGSSKVISVCDAVTGACLLTKKETFLKVGGFDEIWYPIAYSDTDLATKIRRLGLYSLYTPYAVGTHYESISRGPGVYENPEASYWLFQNTLNRNIPQEKLSHPVFLGD